MTEDFFKSLHSKTLSFRLCEQFAEGALFSINSIDPVSAKLE